MFKYAVKETFIVCLILFWGACSPQKMAGVEFSLDFSIKLEKQIYHEDEPFYVEYSLKNVSLSPLLINTRFNFPGPDVYLEIKNQFGKEFRWLPSEVLRAVTKEDFVRLLPGESLSFVLRDIQVHLYQKLTQGVYTIRALYKNNSGKEFGLNAWRGEVYSNAVNLEVQQ